MSSGFENEPATPGGPVGPPTLANLLIRARAAIEHDAATAAQVIDQASALLRPTAPFPFGHGGERERDTPRGGLAPWQMKLVQMHIDANLSSNVTVCKLAGLTRLSASYFGRAFKVSFGVPPHAYVLRRRIERAVHLIRTTRDPLSAIALECGLSDQSHLSRVFKLHVGESPASWRRQHAGCHDWSRSVERPRPVSAVMETSLPSRRVYARG